MSESTHHHSSDSSHSSSHQSSSHHHHHHHHSSSHQSSSSHHHSSSSHHHHHHNSSGSSHSSSHHQSSSEHRHHSSSHHTQHHSSDEQNLAISENTESLRSGSGREKNKSGSSSSSHQSKSVGRHHKNKKNHTARNIVIVLTVFLVSMVATVGMFINSFLNKIDYMNAEKDKTLIADPDFDESVDLPDEYDKYEKDAQDNYGTKGIYSEKNVLNVLICGIDMGDVKDNLYFGRSDSMMILSINNNDDTLRLASLSRAVYVKIPNHRSARLSAAHSYGGPSLLVETIENNYKIRIDNFITVNFEAFKNIIDIFGGIDIYLTDQEATYVSQSLNDLGLFASYSYKGAGTYHLDGKTALMYARARKIDSDRARTGRQRKVLEKIYGKIKNMSVSSIMKVADQVLPLVTTDFSKSEVLSQCTKIPKYMTWNTQETVIPDKSSAIVNIDGVENGVLLVDWDETIAYSKSFLYPLFTEKETTQ